MQDFGWPDPSNPFGDSRARGLWAYLFRRDLRAGTLRGQGGSLQGSSHPEVHQNPGLGSALLAPLEVAREVNLSVEIVKNAAKIGENRLFLLSSKIFLENRVDCAFYLGILEKTGW